MKLMTIRGCKSLIFADGYESSTIVAGVRGINRDLWRDFLNFPPAIHMLS